MNMYTETTDDAIKKYCMVSNLEKIKELDMDDDNISSVVRHACLYDKPDVIKHILPEADIEFVMKAYCQYSHTLDILHFLLQTEHKNFMLKFLSENRVYYPSSGLYREVIGFLKERVNPQDCVPCIRDAILKMKYEEHIKMETILQYTPLYVDIISIIKGYF